MTRDALPDGPAQQVSEPRKKITRRVWAAGFAVVCGLGFLGYMGYQDFAHPPTVREQVRSTSPSSLVTYDQATANKDFSALVAEGHNRPIEVKEWPAPAEQGISEAELAKILDEYGAQIRSELSGAFTGIQMPGAIDAALGQAGVVEPKTPQEQLNDALAEERRLFEVEQMKAGLRAFQRDTQAQPGLLRSKPASPQPTEQQPILEERTRPQPAQQGGRLILAGNQGRVRGGNRGGGGASGGRPDRPALAGAPLAVHDKTGRVPTARDVIVPAATIGRGKQTAVASSDGPGGTLVALVTEDIWALPDDRLGECIAIPARSKMLVRVLGDGGGPNQAIRSRLDFGIEKIILPDGESITLKTDLSDIYGQRGIGGKVNYHVGWRLFGVIAHAVGALPKFLVQSGETEGGAEQEAIKDATSNVSEGIHRATSPFIELDNTVTTHWPEFTFIVEDHLVVKAHKCIDDIRPGQTAWSDTQ